MTGFVIEHKFAVLLIVWLALLVLLVTVWSRGAIRRHEREALERPPRQDARRPAFDMASLPPDAQAELLQAVREKRLIDAIKLVRVATGVDLVTAKAMVEQLAGKG